MRKQHQTRLSKGASIALIALTVIFQGISLLSCNTATSTQDHIVAGVSSVFSFDRIPLHVSNLSQTDSFQKSESGLISVPQVVAQMTPTDAAYINKRILATYSLDLANLGSIQYYTFFSRLSRTQLAAETIDGLSVFIAIKGGYEHRLFKFTNGTAIEDIRFRANISIFRPSEMHLMAEAAFNNPQTGWSMLYLPGKDVANARTQATTTPGKFISFGSLVTRYANTYVDHLGGCVECGGGGGNCTSHSGGVACCDGCNDNGSCGSEQVNAMIETEALKLKPARKFKDDFLSKSAKGKKYIEYYYLISTMSEFTLTKSNLKDHIEFAQLVNQKAGDLENGADETIIVDTEFAKKGRKFIATYRKQSTNKSYQAVLSSIAKDLDDFEGKSRKDVLGRIK